MKKEELFHIIGKVDEQKVAAAGIVMTAKKTRPAWRKWVAIAACLCIWVALLPLLTGSPKTTDDPNPGALAAHFYLNGKGYFYHGELTYELPEGYEYISDVINVGNRFTGTGGDFEGNVDGKIYMSESDPNVAYFSWAEWDEEADGPAPYLKLERKFEDEPNAN